MKIEGDISNIDRVITEDTAKTFNVIGALLNLDRHSYPDCDLSHAKVIVTNIPVPVFDPDGRQIGAANVYQTDTQVLADCTIDYNTPERLDIETGSRPVFAYGLGDVRGTENEFGILFAKEVVIGSVQLLNDPPYDKRIRKL